MIYDVHQKQVIITLEIGYMVWYSIIVNCTPVIGNGTDRDWNFLAISTVWSFVVDHRRSCYLLEYFIKLATKMDKGLVSKRRKSNFNEKKMFRQAGQTGATEAGCWGVCANSKLKASTSLCKNTSQFSLSFLKIMSAPLR